MGFKSIVNPFLNTFSGTIGVNKSKLPAVNSTSSHINVPIPRLSVIVSSLVQLDRDMFQIKNIKISLKIKPIYLNSVLKHFDKERITYKIKNNYVIINNKFVYILFKPRDSIIKHINVTKIPDIESISNSLNLLKDTISYLIILSYKIDNITAVYDYKKEINQLKILNNHKHLFNLKFNKEKFPGLFLKVLLGTFIIFHTGKVNLVGCKDPAHLFNLFEQLKKILE